LRFYAALFVLLFHSRFFADGTLLEIPIYALFSYGWMGVDIFFVLSGFVISYVYSENLQFGDYLVRRFARIYPIYLLTTLAALLILWWLGSPSSFSTPTPFDVWMNLLMLQGWYSEWQGSINFVSWSVSAEFSVYLMFPLILIAAKRLPPNWVGILVPISAFSLFGGLAWAGLSGPVNKCLFEFSSGVMLYFCWQGGQLGLRWAGYLALISLILVLSLSPWMAYFGLPFQDRYLAVLAIPIVVWALSVRDGHPLLLLGGRASYSIYLVHGVVYMILRRMVELGYLAKGWALPAFWLLSLFFALVTYKLVEQPVRRWIVKTWDARNSSPRAFQP